MEFDASRFKLIVVKAGTSVSPDGNGLLDPQGMERMVDGIASLLEQARSVVFVTSARR